MSHDWVKHITSAFERARALGPMCAEDEKLTAANLEFSNISLGEQTREYSPVAKATFNTNSEALISLAIKDLNKERNFLRLHEQVEKAFDHRRLTIVFHGGKLSAYVLDPSLMPNQP
jgi:hypothetical protein